MSKIAVIRIRGMVGLKKEVNSALDRLRLRRKYACVVLENPNESQIGNLKKLRDFVAFGEINDETYKELVEKRGKKDSVQGTKSPTSSAEASSNERKIKPFFRLHPPRGGIDSKKHFGVKKGVLGNNGEEINKLILRML
jgi:large subunit ribosomal protein L30